MLGRSLGLQGRYPVVLNVGRLVEGKGQRRLIPMMRRIRERWPTALLLIAGEGEDRETLEELAARPDVRDQDRKGGGEGKGGSGGVDDGGGRVINKKIRKT